MYPTGPIQFAPFSWGWASETAAAMIAEARDTAQQIAEFVGVSSGRIDGWREHPEFESRVKQLRDQLRARCGELALARAETRLRNMNDRYLGLQKIQRERADYYEGLVRNGDIEAVPGVKTGLVTTKKRGIGSGGNFEIVIEYILDVGFLKAIQELEIVAAKMLGQYNDKETLNISSDAAQARSTAIAELLTPDELADLVDRMKLQAAAKAAAEQIEAPIDLKAEHVDGPETAT